MDITRENFSEFEWPESDLTSEESKRINETLNQLNLELLRKEIGVAEYHNQSAILMGRIEKNSLNFGQDFELFKNFLLSVYKDKEKALESAEHEKEHADFLVKEGVKRFSFKLKLLSNGKAQPYVHYVRPVNLKFGVGEQLSFHQGFVSAPKGHLSETDQYYAEVYENAVNGTLSK